ncbi:MAG: dehydrogenase, partial [Planctomycetaceae bacterium]
LANYPSEHVARIILEQYGDLPTAARQDAVATLASSAQNSRALLQAIADGRVPARDVSAFVARQIEALGDEALSARLQAVWGSVRATSQDRRQLIATYKRKLTAEVLKKADLSHGRLLFSKQCGSCHQLFDSGRAIGPNLTGSQRNNLDYVLENLLDPSAVVGRDFQMTVVLTAQGRVISGIVIREDRKTVTLQTPTDRVIIPVVDVEQRRRQNLSLMPDGMLQKLSTEQVRDLVAYLASARQVPWPPGAEPPEAGAK